MKKLISLLIVLSFSGLGYASGIPVVDAAGLAQRQVEFAESAARWTQTIKQYEKDYRMFENQLKQAQQQYNSITGIRDVKGALNYLGTQNWTMDQLTKWLSNPNSILEKGFDSLTPELRGKVTKLGFAEMCNYTNSQTENSYNYKNRKNCEGKIVLNILQSTKYKNAVDARENEDKDLIKEITRLTTTKDSKESADNTNALLGILIQEQRELKRMIEDQENVKNAEKTLQLQKDAEFKAKQREYLKREMKW